jgi:hypothetical protein
MTTQFPTNANTLPSTSKDLGPGQQVTCSPLRLFHCIVLAGSFEPLLLRQGIPVHVYWPQGRSILVHTMYLPCETSLHVTVQGAYGARDMTWWYLSIISNNDDTRRRCGILGEEEEEEAMMASFSRLAFIDDILIHGLDEDASGEPA